MARKKRTSHRRRSHRRTHHVTRRRRHRRIGAMALTATNPMVQAGSVVLGYFVADTINPMIDKVTGTMDPKLVAAIEVGLGGALVLGKLGKRSMIPTVAGGVLAGAGVKRALRAFGVITGYGQMPVIGRGMLKGYQQVPVVGYNPQSSLNGYPTTSTPINGPSVSHQRIVGNVISDEGGLLRSDMVG